MKNKRQKPDAINQKEVYIIKIYRRSEKPDESLVGTVETIEENWKKTFKTEKELLECLGEAEGK